MSRDVRVEFSTGWSVWSDRVRVRRFFLKRWQRHLRPGLLPGSHRGPETRPRGPWDRLQTVESGESLRSVVHMRGRRRAMSFTELTLQG